MLKKRRSATWIVCVMYWLAVSSPAKSMETPSRSARAPRVEEVMPVPGCVVIDIPGERTSVDSRASVLSEIPTTEILQEALERITDMVEQRAVEDTPTIIPVAGSVCLRCFLYCHKTLGQIKPCAMPLIFVGGVTTIVADAISYAGSADTQTAGYVSLSVMIGSMSLAILYLGCKHYYRKHLPVP